MSTMPEHPSIPPVNDGWSPTRPVRDDPERLADRPRWDATVDAPPARLRDAG